MTEIRGALPETSRIVGTTDGMMIVAESTTIVTGVAPERDLPIDLLDTTGTTSIQLVRDPDLDLATDTVDDVVILETAVVLVNVTTALDTEKEVHRLARLEVR